MGTLADLLDWWNLVFVLPITLSVLLLLASAVGGLGDGDAHAHADMDAHAQVDADGHADHDADADHPLADALKFVGVGVVPISLLLQAFLLLFGVLGLAANRSLNTAASPESLIWGALGIAFLGAVGGMAGIGALGRRYLPQDLPATGNKDLIGRVGRVVFTVTATEGTIQVRDASGALHQVPARVPAGHESLEAGQEIIVADYVADTGAFIIDESPFSLSPEEVRRSA